MSKPVCKIVGFDEFGPLLEWSEHWSKFPVGTALAAYRAQQAQVGVMLGTNPGVTVYDLRPSLNPDSAISAKLVELGWTPPAQHESATRNSAPMVNGLSEAETDQCASVSGLVGRQAAPSEQPAQGEREAFEAWAEDKLTWAWFRDSAWEGWQARAALAQRTALVALTDEQVIRCAKETLGEHCAEDLNLCDMRDFAPAVIAEFCRINGITLSKVKDTAPVNAVNSPKAQEGE